MRVGWIDRAAVWMLAAALGSATGCSTLGFLGDERGAAPSGRPWALASGSATPDERTWEDLMRAADRFRANRDLERATVGYVKALHRDPKRPLPRIRIAQLQLREDPESAAAGFRSVLAIEPDSVQAHAGLGMASLADGRLQQAHDSFERAAEGAPESPLVHAGLAVTLDLLGEPDAAREQLEVAQQLRPETPWLLNNLGVSRLLVGDWVGAETALRAALEGEPGDPTALNNLGIALGRQGRYAEAFAAFRNAGDERAAFNNLGYVCFLNGSYTEAIGHYERALAADGDDAGVVFGNLNAAVDALEETP
jgi:Flp pilus assembly protein TadD